MKVITSFLCHCCTEPSEAKEGFIVDVKLALAAPSK